MVDYSHMLSHLLVIQKDMGESGTRIEMDSGKLEQMTVVLK